MKKVIRYRSLCASDVSEIEKLLMANKYLIEMREVGEFTNFYVNTEEDPDALAKQLGLLVVGSYCKKVKEIIW